jgi:hypothetical protein
VGDAVGRPLLDRAVQVDHDTAYHHVLSRQLLGKGDQAGPQRPVGTAAQPGQLG